MAVRAMSLRRLLGVVFSTLAVLAVVAAGILVFLTNRVHHASSHMQDSAESIWITEELEMDLFRHNLEQDDRRKLVLEEDVWQRLNRARNHVSGAEESAMLDEVRDKAVAYILLSRQAVNSAPAEARQKALNEAVSATEGLIAINLEQAQAEAQHAETANRLANYLGLGLAAVILISVGAFVRWSRNVIRPILAVASAMERFSTGDRKVRVPASGPTELRHIAECFNQMSSALEQQRQMQIAFLAGVAHDLRNPLSALRMSTVLFRADRPLPAEERLRHTLGIVTRQVDRLDRMVGDLLDVANIEAGQLDLKVDKHDLRELIQPALDLLESTSASHEFRLTVPQQRLVVECDPMRVEQVLFNLVSNAMKYCPAGGAVEIAVSEEDGQAVLSVTDQGVGISAEDQLRLFEPFQRVGAAASSRTPGMGLGLFVVRRIVEAHGGHLEVRSAPGEGSTFRVFLPLAVRPGSARPGELWVPVAEHSH